MAGVVWIAEEEDFGDDGIHLLGTFGGYYDSGAATPEEFEGLSAEEAIAWGRARSDTVLIGLGRGPYYSAGARPAPAHDPWPPPDLPALVRRRPPEEMWKDRTPDDEPIAWHVRASLSPPEVASGGPLPLDTDPRRARWEAVVAEAARAAGAGAWDDAELRAFVADLEDAVEAAGDADEVGWATWHKPWYTIALTHEAATAAQAEEAVRERLELPDGWWVEVIAEPPPPNP